MKLVLRRAGEAATLFGAVLLATMSAGCTEETTGFYIQGNVVIDPPNAWRAPRAARRLLSTGVLDVGLTPGDYTANLLVGSQLAPRGDKTNLRTETMVTTMTGAEVRLYNDVGALETEPFTVPATGRHHTRAARITPDSGSSPRPCSRRSTGPKLSPTPTRARADPHPCRRGHRVREDHRRPGGRVGDVHLRHRGLRGLQCRLSDGCHRREHGGCRFVRIH